MRFAPPQLVLDAVAALENASPLVVVTVPALLRAARGLSLDPIHDPVAFGSTEERVLLEGYFALPRPPFEDRPFLAPWASEGKDERWQKVKYPGGALQRQRTDLAARGRVFVHTKAANGRDLWQLTATPGAEFVAEKALPPVRIVDLALWYGRDVDVSALPASVTTGLAPSASDLDRLVAWFVSEFGIGGGDLVGTVYVLDVPTSYESASFVETPIGAKTYELLGSRPPAPSVAVGLDDLVGALEARLKSARFVLPSGLIRRVLTAWLRGDIVVLVGQPGTGKSRFADLLGRAMQAELDLDSPLVIPVRADFDEAEFIGYERLDGSPQLREFASQVLRSDEPLEARVVIFEEFNLASVETYLASVLVALQERDRLVRLPGDEQANLPIDTFILATCNSYRDEPETRTRVSSPAKRRSTIITMPNVLGDRYEADPTGAPLSLALSLIADERARISERVEAGAGAQFDKMRLDRLSTIQVAGDLSEDVRSSFNEVCSAILDSPVGRSWFTLGLLRDVALSIAMAEREKGAELLALGEAVADKLVHQLRGVRSDIQDLRAAYASLPNADEIDRLVDRVSDSPSEELLSLL